MNTLLLLQLLILLFVFFIIYSRSFFFLLLNSLAFLILLVSFSCLHDVDIFSSFLLIIDLGLFLIFFVIALNILLLFQPMIKSFYNRFYLVPIFLFFFLQSNFYLFCCDVIFNISFYDCYGSFSFFFLSELHLLFECYFTFCSFEFFIVNIHLYLAVLAIYYLVFLSLPHYNTLLTYPKRFFSICKKQSLFLKCQNPDFQQSSPQVLRSWAN